MALTEAHIDEAEALDALRSLLASQTVEERKNAVVVLATYTAQTAVQASRPTYATVRVAEGMFSLPTTAPSADVLVTYLVNRLVTCMGSTQPCVRESATFGLAILVSSWLRGGLLTMESIDCIGEKLGVVLSTRDCKPDEAKHRMVGEVFGYRVLFEFGFYNSTLGLTKVEALIKRLCALMEQKSFALIGGDLAADLLTRIFVQLASMTGSADGEVAGKLLANLNGAVASTMKNLAEASRSLLKLRIGFGTQREDADVAALLVPKVTCLLKLIWAAAEGNVLPPAVNKLIKKTCTEPERLMRNVLILGLAASTRKGVVLATLWPSLFGVVLRWQVTRKPFFRTSALHVYLKAVNDIGFNASNAGGPALPHAAQAFRSFLEILMWAKVLKVAAEQGVVDKAYKKLDLDEFYGVTLAHPDTPLIRQFWLTALSTKTDPGNPLASIALKSLVQIVEGKGGDVSAFWEPVLSSVGSDAPTKGGHGKKRKSPASHRQRPELLADLTPFGYMVILDHVQPPLGVTISQRERMQVFDKTFRTGLPLKEETKKEIYEALRGDHAQLKLGNSKSAQHFLSLFTPTQVTPCVKSATSTSDRLDMLRRAVTLATTSGDITAIAAALVVFRTMSEVPRELGHLPSALEAVIVDLPESGSYTPSEKLEMKQMFGDLVAKLKVLLTTGLRKDDFSALNLILETADACSGVERKPITLSDGENKRIWLVNALRIPESLMFIARSFVVDQEVEEDDEAKSLVDSFAASLGALAHLCEEETLKEGDATALIVALARCPLEMPVASAEELALRSALWLQALKSVKALAPVLSVAQHLSSMAAEEAATEADESAFDALWDVVLGHDAVESEGEQGCGHTGACECDNDDVSDASSPEESEEEEGNSEIEEESSQSEEHVAEQKDVVMSEDEEIELNTADDFFKFLGQTDEEAALIAEKKAKMMGLRKAAKEQGKNLEALTIAHGHRVRALKVLEARVMAVSKRFVADEAGEHLDEAISFVHTAVGRMADMLPLLLHNQRTRSTSKVGRVVSSTEEIWQRRITAFIKSSLVHCRSVVTCIVKDRAGLKQSARDWSSHCHNAFVAFANLVQTCQVYVAARISTDTSRESAWGQVAALIDLAGTLNDWVCYGRGGFTPAKATEALQLDDEDEAKGAQEIWALPILGDATLHPTGVRCPRCTQRAKSRGSITCITIPHAEAILANVIVAQAKQGMPRDWENIVKLLRAVVELDAARLPPTLLPTLIAGSTKENIRREVLGLYQTAQRKLAAAAAASVVASQ